MRKDINILQIGDVNWNQNNEVAGISWFFLNDLKTISKLAINDKEVFDVILITSQVNLNLLVKFDRLIADHRVLLAEKNQNAQILNYLEKKHAVDISGNTREEIFSIINKNFFRDQFGSKINIQSIITSLNYASKFEYFGQSKLYLNILKSDSSNYISWEEDLLIKDFDLSIWLEYEKKQSDNINLKLEVTLVSIQSGDLIDVQFFSESQMAESFIIKTRKEGFYASFRLLIEGQGEMEIGNLHYRRSRAHFGISLPGGERLVDSSREEFFVYFDTGNLKPPLNVYFSGYRPLEGFEGYPMMKNLKHPFILVSDPRLEGGEFYLSNKGELEQKLVEFINFKLQSLRFKDTDLNLLGLSMGTTGALYYSTLLSPSNVVIGKPLVDLNRIAVNGTQSRTEEFLTSFDIVSSLNFDTLLKPHISKQNLKNPNTVFYVIYMLDDDYDEQAIHIIKKGLGSKIKIVEKGFEGRHNDNTGRVIEWFLIYIREILESW